MEDHRPTSSPPPCDPPLPLPPAHSHLHPHHHYKFHSPASVLRARDNITSATGHRGSPWVNPNTLWASFAPRSRCIDPGNRSLATPQEEKREKKLFFFCLNEFVQGNHTTMMAKLLAAENCLDYRGKTDQSGRNECKTVKQKLDQTSTLPLFGSTSASLHRPQGRKPPGARDFV